MRSFNISLADRIVLVTGGSRGIGRAIVETLGQAGATLAVHYHRRREAAEALADAAPEGSAAFAADLSDPAGVEDLAERVLARYGRVDVLVNNAGIALSSDFAPTHEDFVSEWERTQRVNLLAPSLLTRALVPGMVARGGGRLIHIASRAAFRGDTLDYVAYAASKGGLVAMSRSLARGLGRHNIQSFVVAPGFVRTDMAQDFMDAYGEEYALSDIALPQLTQPADVAPTVLFLASGHMDHATGCSIDVNAGSYVR